MQKRKVVMRVLAAIALTASLGLNVGAYEYGSYPDYMNGDYNFPLLHGNSNVGTFLDMTSITKLGEADGCYVWAVNCVLSKDGGDFSTFTMYYAYNPNTGACYSRRGKEGSFHKIDMDNTASYMEVAVKGLRKTLYPAYGISV